MRAILVAGLRDRARSRRRAATPGRRKATADTTPPTGGPDHDGQRRRPQEERAGHGAGRDRHRDRGRDDHVEDQQPRPARYAPLVDGIKAYFDDGQRRRRHLRPQARRRRRPRRPVRPEPRRRCRQSLVAGQGVRDVRRDDAVHRRRRCSPRRSSRRSSGTSTPSSPATRRSSPTTARSASRAPATALPWLAKQLGATKVGVLAYGIAAAVEGLRDGHQERRSRSTRPRKVVFDDDSLGYAQPLGAAGHADEEEGRRSSSSPASTCRSRSRSPRR